MAKQAITDDRSYPPPQIRPLFQLQPGWTVSQAGGVGGEFTSGGGREAAGGGEIDVDGFGTTVVGDGAGDPPGDGGLSALFAKTKTAASNATMITPIPRKTHRLLLSWTRVRTNLCTPPAWHTTRVRHIPIESKKGFII
eukprot:1195792-Prorocentrum_minimum.AAC.4